jgi:hypothetical protein
MSTLRPDLAAAFEEFSLEADRQGFIGHRVFPVFDAAVKSGVFGRIPIEELLENRETRRAPGSGYSRGSFTFTDDSFACVEHGAEEIVDDAQSNIYANYLDAEMVAAQRAFDVVLRNAEKRVAAAVFNSTTWNGSDLTTAPTNEWDDPTNAEPLIDVENAVKKVWEGSGIWPNALVINRRVFRNLRNCDEIIDRVKYSGFMDTRAGNITREALAQCFDLDFILIAGSAANTAQEGQDAAIGALWSDEYAMVCRIAGGQDIAEPCIGRTFHYTGDGSEIDGRVEQYREEKVRGDVIRVRHDVDEKVLYPQLGHLISNVTT